MKAVTMATDSTETVLKTNSAVTKAKSDSTVTVITISVLL